MGGQSCCQGQPQPSTNLNKNLTSQRTTQSSSLNSYTAQTITRMQDLDRYLQNQLNRKDERLNPLQSAMDKVMQTAQVKKNAHQTAVDSAMSQHIKEADNDAKKDLDKHPQMDKNVVNAIGGLLQPKQHKQPKK